MRPLKCRVAELKQQMIETKPRGYWNKMTIEKWLADQGFIVGNEKLHPIGKSFNRVTRTAFFVQSVYDT